MSDRRINDVDYLHVIEHDGEEILRIDLSGCAGEELARRVGVVASVVRSSPARSLLTLTRLHGLPCNKENITLLSDYVQKNGPYVLAGAVVGLDHFSHALSPVNRLTGRSLRTFDDEESARSFLVAEKRRLETAKTPTVDEPQEAVRWVEHDGEKLLVMEWGNCDGAELLARIEKATSIIHRQAPRSVIALNFLDNFPFGRETHRSIIDFVGSNRPYVIAAAAVGLGYMKAALPVLNRFTNRNIRAFDDPERAKEWLVSEKRRILGS